MAKAHGKVWLFAVCHGKGTQQTRRERRMAVRPLYFAMRQIQHTAVFAVCPRKGTRQTQLCRLLFAVSSLPCVAQSPFGFCRVPWAHGKYSESGSDE